jgi:hypothetical protein
MDGSTFDKWTRLFADRRSRRAVVKGVAGAAVAVAAVAAMPEQNAAADDHCGLPGGGCLGDELASDCCEGLICVSGVCESDVPTVFCPDDYECDDDQTCISGVCVDDEIGTTDGEVEAPNTGAGTAAGVNLAGAAALAGAAVIAGAVVRNRKAEPQG